MVQGSFLRMSSVALLAFTTCAGSALAQTYPAKPIRIIVPQSAGGSTDLVARPLAKVLGETMGTSFVVENRPARVASSAAMPWPRRHRTATRC